MELVLQKGLVGSEHGHVQFGDDDNNEIGVQLPLFQLPEDEETSSTGYVHHTLLIPSKKLTTKTQIICLFHESLRPVNHYRGVYARDLRVVKIAFL